MTYNIVHRTLYEYAAPVAVSHHVARLEPRATNSEARESSALQIFPDPTLRRTRQDYFGNPLCFFSIQEVHRRLEIITHSRVTLNSERPIVTDSSLAWEREAGMFRDPVSPDVVGPYQFVFDSPQVRASFELADYARQSFPDGTPVLAGARELTQRI